MQKSTRRKTIIFFLHEGYLAKSSKNFQGRTHRQHTTLPRPLMHFWVYICNSGKLWCVKIMTCLYHILWPNSWLLHARWHINNEGRGGSLNSQSYLIVIIALCQIYVVWSKKNSTYVMGQCLSNCLIYKIFTSWEQGPSLKWPKAEHSKNCTRPVPWCDYHFFRSDYM